MLTPAAIVLVVLGFLIVAVVYFLRLRRRVKVVAVGTSFNCWQVQKLVCSKQGWIFGLGDVFKVGGTWGPLYALRMPMYWQIGEIERLKQYMTVLGYSVMGKIPNPTRKQSWQSWKEMIQKI